MEIALSVTPEVNVWQPLLWSTLRQSPHQVAPIMLLFLPTCQHQQAIRESFSQDVQQQELRLGETQSYLQDAQHTIDYLYAQMDDAERIAAEKYSHITLKLEYMERVLTSLLSMMYMWKQCQYVTH